jgi:hypothetical protein
MRLYAASVPASPSQLGVAAKTQEDATPKTPTKTPTKVSVFTYTHRHVPRPTETPRDLP